MNFLCNDLYSSSLFYCLVVFSAHTGDKGDLDLRQLFLIIKKTKKSQTDIFKFKCATYDTLNAVKIVLQSESERFLF